MSEHWDELASAHLDGEATAEEVALIQNSPEARRALDELRTVSEANADVPPPPDSVRSLHLGAAMSLFDDIHTATAVVAEPVGEPRGLDGSKVANDTTASTDTRASTDTTASNVIPLRRRAPAAWLGRAAAAVVVVAGLGFTASQLDRSTDDSTSSDEVAASPSATEELEADMMADEASQMAAAESEESTLAEADSADADVATEATSSDDGETSPADSAAASDDTAGSEDTGASDTEASVGERSTESAVADLTADDDLLAVATLLDAENLMSSDPATDAGQLLEEIQTRCPTMFEGRGPAIAAPILFDDEFALLVFTTSPTERAMVVTTNCVTLAAAG